MSATTDVNPQIQIFLKSLDQTTHPHASQISIEEGRAAYEAFAKTQAGEPLTLAKIENFKIPSKDSTYQIPARFYAPVIGKKLPLLIYYHGGGWQRGSLETHDSICRYLSVESECAVISVQWRLAPEHKFLVGVTDCINAYLWILQHLSEFNVHLHRVMLAGDSAGGNMTASSILQLRDQKLPLPHFHALFYPSLDLSCSSPSYQKFKDGYFLSTERVKYYVSGYIKDERDIENPYVSPLKGDFTGFPPALVVTAEFDPLHDEGKAYAEKLKSYGIAATYMDCPGMIHAFLHMTGTVPEVKTIFKDIGRIIRENLG